MSYKLKITAPITDEQLSQFQIWSWLLCHLSLAYEMDGICLDEDHLDPSNLNALELLQGLISATTYNDAGTHYTHRHVPRLDDLLNLGLVTESNADVHVATGISYGSESCSLRWTEKAENAYKQFIYACDINDFMSVVEDEDEDEDEDE